MRFCSSISSIIKNGFRFVLPTESRVNRAKFLAAHIPVVYTFILLLALAGLVVIYSKVLGARVSGFLLLILIALNAIYIVFIVVWSILITIKRLHDINCSGWWYMIYFLVIGYVVTIIGEVTKFSLLTQLHQFLGSIILVIIPGTNSENKFGVKPKKSTKPVYMLALLWCASSVLICCFSDKLPTLWRDYRSLFR